MCFTFEWQGDGLWFLAFLGSKRREGVCYLPEVFYILLQEIPLPERTTISLGVHAPFPGRYAWPPWLHSSSKHAVV